MPLTSFKFTNVGPFNEIEFEFDAHINVFAGPNNTGKSTALMVLANTVVYPFSLPKKLLKKSDTEFKLCMRKGRKITPYTGPLPLDFTEDAAELLDILKTAGYTSFIPALRQSTDVELVGLA